MESLRLSVSVLVCNRDRMVAGIIQLRFVASLVKNNLASQQVLAHSRGARPFSA